MAKNIFSGWKKFSTNGKNTIMAHPNGHKMIIQHKHLKPEHLEQLHGLPFHTAEEGRLKATKMTPSGSPKPPKMAEGGPVPAGTKKEYPGIAYDLDTPTAQWEASKRPHDAASQVTTPEAPKATPPPAPDYDPERDTQINHKSPVKALAEGGDPAEAPIAPAEEQAAPVEAVAPVTTPAPAIDPVIAEKRKIYNSLVAGPVDAKGGTPDADAGTAKQFGADGSAPQQFDASAWQAAESKYGQNAQAQAQQSQTQALAATAENKSRAAAGLPPVPGVIAQAAAQQDPQLQKAAQAATTPQPPGDPYGTQAYSDAYVKGVNEQKQGLTQEATAQQRLGDAEAQRLQTAQENEKHNLQDYQTHFQNLDTERKNLVQDINDQHINPNHYLGDMGTASKVGTAIGLIAGGLGAGLLGQANPALDFLNKQIDRDIAAQKANLGKSENLLSANMRQFQNQRDATDMTRVMQNDIISNQMKQEAAKATGPLAKARLLQAAGALDQQSAPIMSQIAMRKTLLGGMAAGRVAPEQVIRAIVPPAQQEPMFKELKEAEGMVRLRDQALSAFDQISAINTKGNRLLNPVQSKSQIEKLIGSIVPTISKESAGRYTESDAAAIEHVLVSTPWDDANSRALGRRELDKLMSSKLNFPQLKAYGIGPEHIPSRFDPSGKSRIPESAPNLKR